MEIKFKKLYQWSRVPTKGREWDACFDLYSAVDIIIEPHRQHIIPTWIAMAIPDWFYWQIESRSWLASKGYTSEWWVIDSNYRWDVWVVFYNHTNEPYKIYVWDRIAQIWIHKVEEVVFKETEELEDWIRWTEWFWSSGK